MTVAEADRALVRVSEDEPSEPCHYAWSEFLPGVVFMVLEGRIARIDVSGKAYRAQGGARVGASEEEMRRLYPTIGIEQHPYLEAGRYLVRSSPGGRHAMIFETDGRLVTSFRAGEREAVGWIGGCE